MDGYTGQLHPNSNYENQLVKSEHSHFLENFAPRFMR